MAYKNKADQAVAARRHYEANKQKMKARAVVHKAKQRGIIMKYIKETKDVPCTDCNTKYPYYVMQFDHIGTDKLFNIADCYSGGFSLDKVRQEVAKCEVVCANCHAERTWERRSNPTSATI
jgi:hypothetical protein